MMSPKIDIDRDCVEPEKSETDSSPDEESLLEDEMIDPISDDEDDDGFT